MSTAHELDRPRVEALLEEILLPIRRNYSRGPISRDRALEALNALACAVSLVVAGAESAGDKDGTARAFFRAALKAQLEDRTKRDDPTLN